MRTYDIFISHAWSYDERYEGVVRLLNSVWGFSWRDYSVPRSAPVVDRNSVIGVNALTGRLREQIRQSSCFVLIAGMFVHHRDWVQREIRIAQDYGKPIIAVRRRGQLRTPIEVENYAHATVNWNSVSLVEAIRRHA